MGLRLENRPGIQVEMNGKNVSIFYCHPYIPLDCDDVSLNR